MEDKRIQRWEYVRIQAEVNGIKKIDGTVDQLGREGWELTGVIEAANSYVHLWFKRPL